MAGAGAVVGVAMLAGVGVVLGRGAVVAVDAVIAGAILMRWNGVLVAAVMVAVAIETVGGTLVVTATIGESNCAAADWVCVYPAA